MIGAPKEIEALFIASFVNSGYRPEWRELSSRWTRKRRLNRCLREESFEPRWQEFEHPWRSAREVIDLLRGRGAGPHAYLVSADPRLDAETHSLEDAIVRSFDSGQATVIVCDPQRLAYFTPGAPGRRYVLVRPHAYSPASDPAKRTAVLKQFNYLWELIQDGSPFSDGFQGDEQAFLVDEILNAPSDEVDTIIDLLRNPPIDLPDERGLSEWDYHELPISSYLIGHLVTFPDRFAPISEELVQHPVTGKAFLSAIGGHFTFLGISTNPFLPALRVAAVPPWDEDKVLSLTCALGEASDPEALTILDGMRQALANEPKVYLDWVGQSVEKVRRRLAGEESQKFRTEIPQMVAEARRVLAARIVG